MTLIQPIRTPKNKKNVRAPYSSTTLRTQPRTHTELIPLEKLEGKNELVGQNKKNQRREDVLKVSKVPKTMSCGQGGAKWSASESRVVQARYCDACLWPCETYLKNNSQIAFDSTNFGKDIGPAFGAYETL